MEENKTTFGPDEKDTLEILALFEQELEGRLEQSKREVEKVKYYETFDINEINFKNIFITTEKDAKGNITYHVYCGDSSNEILSIDSDGNVEVKNEDLEKYIDEIDLNSLMKENEKEPEKFKGISEKATPEEAKKALEGEKTADEQKEEKDEETQEVEQDLEEQGEDLRISKYRKIKDSHISERMPEVFEDGTENGIAFSNKLNKFVIISKIDGHYQVNENVEPAKMTWKTIISISPDGEQVERKVPHSLMKIPNNDEKEIAVTLDEYGTPSIETIDVMPCQERIARAVREENEGLDEQEDRPTTNNIDNEGKLEKHNLAHNDKILKEEYDVTKTDIEELKELDIEALMEAEAQKAKISKENFKEYVKKAEGKTLQEKIDNAHEEIEQQYKGGQKPR